MSRFACLFLHIGPHKTGSSAIQAVCDQNRAVLERHGVLYPSGHWHAQLGSCFSRNKLAFVYNKHTGNVDLGAIDASDRAYIASLEEQFRTTTCEKAVLSYEGFVDLNPDGIVSLRQFLEKYAEVIRIIAYCRHPLSFAPSEISQRARMGIPIATDGAAEFPIPKFRAYFEKFEAAFRRDSICLTEFARTALYKQDVRLDFLAKLGIGDREIAEFQLAGQGDNESLSAEAVHIGEAMARQAGAMGQRSLFFRRYNNALTAIKGVPITLSPEEEDKIMATAQPHLDYLKRSFGMELTRPPPRARPRDKTFAFSEQTVDYLAKQLIDSDDVSQAYRWLLGRMPDSPDAVYRHMIAAGGGWRRLRANIMGSPEYRAIAAAAATTAQLPPQTAIFTPTQQTWVSSAFGANPYVLLARFRAVPDSRPTIHLRDQSLLRMPRIALSVDYIDDLISRYILHHEYYHAYEDVMPSREDDLFCVFDVGDITSDLPMTVGYGSKGHHMTLIPDPHFWRNKGYFSQREAFKERWVTWSERERVVFWRGSSTGALKLTADSFPNLPRYRLCAAGATGAKLQGVLDAKLTDIVQAKSVDEKQRIQVLVESHGLLSARVPHTEFLRYRFQIDIDGNVNAWGLLLKLLMGSCVLKVMSEWRQWYYDRLQPWVHYVPVKNDLSDLEEQVAWCLEHDDEAQEIGARGRGLAKSIVFETELPRAAARLLEASSTSTDDFFLAPNSRQLNHRIIRSNPTMPVFDLSGNSVEALFAEFRGGRDAFGPFSPPTLGGFNGPALAVTRRDVLPSADWRASACEPYAVAEMAYLLYSVRTAGERYRLLSLGAAPGEWAVRAERAYKKRNPNGDYGSFNVEGDIGHVEMMIAFFADNFADPNENVILYKAVAEKDGWAYFPVINPKVDWGAGIAALSENPDDLALKINITDRARQDRIGANGGAPLEFRRIPAVSLGNLLTEIGPVDFVHSDIQGTEADIFPAHMRAMSDWVRICCIGTHGPEIETKLLHCFEEHDWHLECAYPCTVNEGICRRDGVFVWVNPRAHQAERFDAPSLCRPERRDAHISYSGSATASPLASAIDAALRRALSGEGKLGAGVLALEGMSGRRYRLLINNLIESLDNPRYLEVGVWAGSTLCSAIYKNKVTATAIDDWSQFGGPADRFFANVAKFRTAEAKISFLEKDFRAVDYSLLGKHNVYLFDGPHATRDQYDGVVIAQPALDDQFVLIVDDWNWSPVREGTMGALRAARLDVDYSVEIRTSMDNSHPDVRGAASDWHNGYFIAALSRYPDSSARRAKPLSPFDRDHSGPGGVTNVEPPDRRIGSAADSAGAPGGSPTCAGSADEFITAAYRAVLGRDPGPIGLGHFRNVFAAASPPEGIEQIVRALMRSEEFESK